MKKKKRILAFSFAMVLGLCTVTGCGKQDAADKEKEIVVGATIKPHSEILNSKEFTESIEELGYTVKVMEYTDYIQPNQAVSDGSLDANFFQHQPYLDSFNKDNKTTLVSAAKVHYEPLALYGGKTKSLDALKEGAVFAVPNDSSNEARALQLLEEAGLITLKEDAGLNATINDITSNPHKISIKEIESAQTALVLKDVDFAVINGNYALQEGLNVEKDALIKEDASSEASDTYSNIVVVKEEMKDSEKTKALVKAITSEEVKQFIHETYQGAVVPAE